MQGKMKSLRSEKSIAMLAPAFPLDFKYPNIIGMLKKLGFDKVVELTYGARMVNWAYADYIKNNPDQELFIASPCPTIISFIKNQYPEFAQYLMPISSPMVAAAKICKNNFPEHRIFFISPCNAKESLEIPKYPELIDGVITFKQLKEIFEANGIAEDDFGGEYYFDSFVREYTKIYPISGGLASTSHIGKLFNEGEIFVTDGVVNIKKALEDFRSGNSKFRFLDILNCDGGCIGGPAIINRSKTVKEKQEIILEYTRKSSLHTMGEQKGTVDVAEGIDFSGII